MAKTYYEILEVSPRATTEEIRTAYKRLALLHHSDRNNSSLESTERFKEIGQAHEVLSDEKKRSNYDLTGNPDGNDDDGSEYSDMDESDEWSNANDSGPDGSDPDDSGPDDSDDDEEVIDFDDDPDLLQRLRKYLEEHEEMISDFHTGPKVKSQAAKFERYCSSCCPDLPDLRFKISHIVSTPNVETYTGLFHYEPSSPSKKRTRTTYEKESDEIRGGITDSVATPIVAVARKGARLYPYRHGLLSRDKDGQELGYQDPESVFNGRAPYYVEIDIGIPSKKKWVPLPIVCFHAPYGSSSKSSKPVPKSYDKETIQNLPTLGNLRDEPLDETLLAMRRESLVNLPELGIPTNKEGSSKGIRLGDFDNAIIAGDFNMDITRESESKNIAAAYGALRKAGFNEVIHNTRTTLRVVDSILPARGEENARAEDAWYSAAYDNILVKRQDLVYCDTGDEVYPIVAGAIDVFQTMEDHKDDFMGDADAVEDRVGNHENYHPTAKYPAHDDPNDEMHGPRIRARNELARYRRCESDRERAFFLYRRYISDHLPVFLDFFVIEGDASAPDVQPGASGISGSSGKRSTGPKRAVIGITNEGLTCYLNAALQLLACTGIPQQTSEEQLTTLAAANGNYAAATALAARGITELLRTQAAAGSYNYGTLPTDSTQQHTERIYLDGTTRALRQNLLDRFLIDRVSGVNEDSATILGAILSGFFAGPQLSRENDDNSFDAVENTPTLLRRYYTEYQKKGRMLKLPSEFSFVVCVRQTYADTKEKVTDAKLHTVEVDEDMEFRKYDLRSELLLEFGARKDATTEVKLQQLLLRYADLDTSSATGTESKCYQDGDRGAFYGRVTRERTDLASDAPSKLLVQLKRFEWLGHRESRKIPNEVKIGEEETFFGAEYELQGFIRHIGGRLRSTDLKSGHYVSYCQYEGVWYRLDDSQVTPKPDDLEEARNNAYVYYFTRKK